MTWLDRLTTATNVFMTISLAFSASLSSGHAFHVVCAVLWAVLAVWNWHTARVRVRTEAANKLTLYADALTSVGATFQQPAVRASVGPVSQAISIGAYEAAAEVRTQAAAILRGSP